MCEAFATARWRLMAPFLCCAAAIAAVLAMAGPAGAQQARYSCADGPAFSAEPRRGGAAMLLTLEPAGIRIQLDQSPASVGERYEGGGYVFVDRHHTVLLTAPGAAPVECDVLAAAGGAPAGGSSSGSVGPAATVRPSFSCAGNLATTEREICASPALAELDVQMADVFAWLIGELPADRHQALRDDQRAWLATRNGCGSSFSCLEGQYYDRIAYLNEYIDPAEQPASDLPRAAKSWGGVVRSGPGMEYQRVTNLAEGDPITIEADTGVVMNGYNWYEISWGDRRGYQWGGIICPLGTPLDGAFDVCN